MQTEGGGITALKVKLKILKQQLKQWNHEVFGDLYRRRREIVDKLNDLEKKAEDSVLQEDEVRQRREYGAEF